MEEYPKLYDVYSKLFIRAIDQPSESERKYLLQLPDTDPAVMAFEDKWTANNLIFFLGRMAADDFGQVLMLGGNGAGFGAFIHLRGMYERLVTALYLAKKPSEARIFAQSSPLNKLNFLTRLRELIPELKQRYDKASMDQIKKDAAAAKAARKESICPKCLTPKTTQAWTRASLDSMARGVDADLESLYGPIYLEGTYQAHANSLGMERRLIHDESGSL